MSGLFKSIGKIFKKVVKTIIKIAPYALAAAAVIFTGGAALGLLPTFAAAMGGLVSTLGMSAALTGALTGALTSAGFGAALGFITGGKKGLKKGFLMGALTGGVMGFANPAMFGIANGANGVTTTNALAHGGDKFAAAKGLFHGSSIPAPDLNTPAQVNLDSAPLDHLAAKPIEAGGMTFQGTGPSTTNAVTSAAGNGTVGIAPTTGVTPALTPSQGVVQATQSLMPTATPPATGGTGIINQLLGGTGGVGGVIGPVLQALGGSDNSSSQEAKARMKLGKWAYGGVYSGNPDAFGVAGKTIPIPEPRYYYDQATNEVVDRQQPQAAPAGGP